MTVAATLLVAALPLSPMHAQAGTTPRNDSVSADAKLIRQAAADNLLEVRLGELAQHQATNPTVQKFGQRMIAMIKGHAKAATELEAQVDSARSEPVRKMAAYALPIVREHLLAARAAAKEVGVDSATVARSHDKTEGK
jgi:predicted outer membrane protein